MSDTVGSVADAPEVLAFGSWPSDLSPAAAAVGAVRVSSIGLDVAADGSTIVRWSEQRPDLGGRIVVCRARVSGHGDDVGGRRGHRDGEVEGPADMSARSGVNEYGGGSWWGDGERLFWVDGPTGAIFGIDRPGGAPRRVTAASLPPRAERHAAGVLTPDRRWIVCERELHPVADRAEVASGDADERREPINDLAAVAVDGGAPVTLVRDGDWATDPAISPDGTVIAWLRWDHPDMPWDAAEVWAARLGLPDPAVPGSSDVPAVTDARRVVGGRDGGRARGLGRPVAACLPSFSPDGRLWWCDDAADWWHLRCAPEPGLPPEGAGDDGPPALDVAGEVGEPRWVSGGRRYGFTGDGRVVVVLQRDGLDSLQVWDPATGSLIPAPAPDGGFTSVEHISVCGSVVGVAGGGGARPTSAWTVDLDAGVVTDHRRTPLLDPASVSIPTAVSFPTGGGEQAHALFYAPCSPVAVGPPGARPPLIVRIHGGPTAAARAEYSTSVQFWTSRGFAVADVNYRGSTGYGRRYRDLLTTAWGVADVQDCVAAVTHLAAEGLVDGGRCVIRGGSAGGFTALEATCRSEVFAAACSLYGVTDLRSLATDTHKFESRYLDGLVGPWPEAAERYRDRSPLHHAELLDRPVLLLQGSDDPIVPPSQARVLRDALRRNDVPHALIVFEGEAHGFRSATTIVRALQAELSFYGEVVGFVPADDLPPLTLQR